MEDGSSNGGDDEEADVKSNEDGGTERTDWVDDQQSQVEDKSNKNGGIEDRNQITASMTKWLLSPIREWNIEISIPGQVTLKNI